MAIQVNPTVSPRIITVPEADGVSITIQSLVNQIRAWEDDQASLSYPKLLSAAGKEDLGGGTAVGITAILENTKLKFAARASPTTCYVGGGNLVAIDANGDSMFPIEPSTNVTVQLAQSSSATIIQDADIDAIKAKTDNLPSTPADETTLAAVKTKTDNLPADPAVQSILETIIDKIKHYSGTYDPDKESLEAIRARLDEVYDKLTGVRKFGV